MGAFGDVEFGIDCQGGNGTGAACAVKAQKRSAGDLLGDRWGCMPRVTRLRRVVLFLDSADGVSNFNLFGAFPIEHCGTSLTCKVGDPLLLALQKSGGPGRLAMVLIFGVILNFNIYFFWGPFVEPIMGLLGAEIKRKHFLIFFFYLKNGKPPI